MAGLRKTGAKAHKKMGEGPHSLNLALLGVFSAADGQGQPIAISGEGEPGTARGPGVGAGDHGIFRRGCQLSAGRLRPAPKMG
jgi:hypothetical protein